MTSLEERFEAKVDRTDDHHLWTGSKKADGTGKLKVDGRIVTAQRVAWELANGTLPADTRVASCPDQKACVRVEHLSLIGEALPAASPGRRAAPGEGSFDRIGSNTWKLTLGRGRYEDGKRRRIVTTIKADTELEARRAKAEFIAEVNQERLPATRDARDFTLDEVAERFLEYLSEKGREERTLQGYRQIHDQWFSPELGKRRARDFDEAAFDRIFGRMRRAGLSKSRMSKGLHFYKPLFRWAKRRGVTRSNPLADFELPKSTYVPKRRVPPEVHQMCLLLNTAVEHTPEIAPILTLDAVTGMRRSEIPAVRRTSVDRRRGLLFINEAADRTGTKRTKTDQDREVSLSDETLDLLDRVEDEMRDRAAASGIELPNDAFLFSLEPDGSKPMPPDYLTKRLAVLKDVLGIHDKRPDTVALEDEALRLYREGDGKPWTRPPGRRGPRPKGAMAYSEIGERLGRSDRWAQSAIRSAERREKAAANGEVEEWFDGSFLGIRKFTTTELLDAGFDIYTVTDRQGHSPEVARKHYTKNRRSTNRRASDYLSGLVHRQAHDPSPPSPGIGGL